MHSKNWKFGIYTDRGTKTCAGRPGSLGYEAIDAQTYASWGVDYLKEDSCFASQDHDTAFKEYGLMRDALNNTGRRIYFSLCGWAEWYSPVGWSLGNSWRISGDCNQWSDVLRALNTNAPLFRNARPGGWNDPDMLLGSTQGTAASLPQSQSRTMFSLWCIMSAPLLLGTHKMNSFDLETYKNTELIAVNQDSLGYQGRRLVGGNLSVGDHGVNIWGKKLSKGGWAVAFLNNGPVPRQVHCGAACFLAMSFSLTDVLTAYDYWAHKVVSTNVVVSKGYSPLVGSNGHSVVLRFSK